MDNNSKRIAKNTIFLYLRMLFLMFIALFTSRVVLDKLGIEDYGINNVIGGLAAMFAFFSSSLANATQRFINIELGHENTEGANRIFNQHLLIYLIIIICVVLLAETIGLWIVENKLTIPSERLSAALCVYHFTIISLAITLLGVVFNSLIIAHEDMKIYSYVGIIEGLLKLAVAYAISVLSFDRLITYSFLLLLITFCTQASYAYYCFCHYKECRLKYVYNKKEIKDTFSFISWNVVGTAIYATKDQGINILLNIHFGPIVNAARAVAYQVNSAVVSFGSNFFTSVRPQIIKSYAKGEMEYLTNLFLKSSKYSLFLMWYIILPVILCIDILLGLWLVEVPPQTNIFIIWVLADSLLAMLTNPTWSITLAVGELKKYTLLGNGCLILILPISWYLIQMGYGAICVFIVTFIIRIVQIVCVLLIIEKFVSISLKQYIKEVILPAINVFIISGFITYYIRTTMDDSFHVIIIITFFSIFFNTMAIWALGMKKNEKVKIISLIKSNILKNHDT